MDFDDLMITLLLVWPTEFSMKRSNLALTSIDWYESAHLFQSLWECSGRLRSLF